MSSPWPALEPEEQEEKREEELEARDLIHTLKGYIQESEDARKQGPSPRDTVWALNWNAYWGHNDFSEKETWQSRNVMPEVPQYVERFTAAITQALVQSAPWFTIEDPAGKLMKVMPIIEKTVRVMLDRSARNHTGQRIGFEKPFGDSIKAGCLMMIAMSVTWQDGALLIEPVDARELYFDPSGRNLYRIRRYEIDRYQLEKWKEQVDSNDEPLFDAEAIDNVVGRYAEDADQKLEKERSSGHGQEVKWQRRPVRIDEFLATVLDIDGKAAGEKELVVMANQQDIIRGPEENPYWHGMDWIVAAPLITVPFSVYGRSYVESFRQLADAFTELTNLINDAVFTNCMNAFMAWPSKLKDPTQLNEGVSPNKVFIADEEESNTGEDFIRSIQLGNPQAVRDGVAIWQGMKQELREGGMQNELNLGQLPPKGDITATEINASEQGTNTLTTHVAGNIESYLLSPIVELSWMTTVQMIDPSDADISDELGPEIVGMLAAQKEDFRGRRFRYKAKGITTMIERSRRIRNLLQFLTVVSSNEVMLKVFLERFSGPKIIERLMRDFGIDPNEIEKSQEEMMKDAMEAARERGLMARGGAPPGRSGSPPAVRGAPPGGPA